MKRVLSLLLVVLLAMGLIGFANAESPWLAPVEGDVTLRFSHGTSPGTPEGDLFVQQLEEFTSKTGIKLQQEIVAGDEMRNKIATDIAAGNMPDLSTFWGKSLMRDYAKAGYLLNVKDYFANGGALKFEDIDESVWGLYLVDGEYYGFPTNAYTGYFAVNKELFEQFNLEYPKTYADLLAVSKVFNENGIAPLAVGSKGGNPSHFWISDIIIQLGGEQEIYDFTENWTWATEIGYKASNIVADMVQNGVFMNDTVANGDWQPSFALFNEGKAAMLYSYNWMCVQIKPELLDKIELVPMPMVDGAVVDPATFVGYGANHGVIANAASYADANKTQAMTQLLDFFLKDVMKGRAEMGLNITVDKTIEYDRSGWTNKMLDMVLTYNEQNNLRPVTCQYNEWPDTDSWNYYQMMLDDLWAGNISGDEFAKQTQDYIDENARAAGVK